MERDVTSTYLWTGAVLRWGRGNCPLPNVTWNLVYFSSDQIIGNTLTLTCCADPTLLELWNDLISVQPPRSIRSSSVVTISRPPTSSSLKITNRSFRYSAPYLWNQLRESFPEPHPHLSISASQSHFLGHARSPFSSVSPLSPSITPSLFRSTLKWPFPHIISTIVIQS